MTLIPAKYRKIIYAVFASAMAVEAVLDLVPQGAQDRILAVAVALGFSMATANTNV